MSTAIVPDNILAAIRAAEAPKTQSGTSIEAIKNAPLKKGSTAGKGRRTPVSEDTVSLKAEAGTPKKTGHFQKGTSGNPTGRPKGALGKATLVKQALAAEAEGILLKGAAKVIAVVVEQAKGGCTKSQKLIWDSVLPKKRAIELSTTGKKDNIISINIETLVAGNDKHEPAVEGEYTEISDGNNPVPSDADFEEVKDAD